MTKIYIHPRLGEITIKRVSLSRRVKLSVHPLRGINVTIPWLVSYSRAIEFINEKESWISATLIKQSKRRQEEAIKIGPGSPLMLIGKEISYEKIRRESVEEDVISVIRKEAKKYLPERVSILAGKFGFKPGRVTIRNNRSNWGSCSKSGNISLNMHLMRLSPELADFVIIHELCHLRHRNHGAHFHALLDSLCDGKEKEFNKLLRKERPQVSFLLIEK
jgi:predicted metal-dependent hydrolase